VNRTDRDPEEGIVATTDDTAAATTVETALEEGNTEPADDRSASAAEPASLPESEPVSDPAADPVAQTEEVTSSPPAKASRLPLILLGALVVAAAVVVGLLSWQAFSASQAQRNAEAALDAARTRTVQVLSYDPKTLDADLARARAQLSGAFAVQFDQLITSVIKPASKEQGLASKVEVIRSALIDSQPDRAEALLFLRQSITTTAVPQPQQETIQVKATMAKTEDGQWLISNLEPL